MDESSTNKPDASEEELLRLATKPDDDIDTTDIPEIRDWSGAERGKFYHPDAEHQVPLYLDSDVLEFLTARAKAKGIEPVDLANEMLKKDIGLVCLVESGAKQNARLDDP